MFPDTYLLFPRSEKPVPAFLPFTGIGSSSEGSLRDFTFASPWNPLWEIAPSLIEGYLAWNLLTHCRMPHYFGSGHSPKAAICFVQCPVIAILICHMLFFLRTANMAASSRRLIVNYSIIHSHQKHHYRCLQNLQVQTGFLGWSSPQNINWVLGCYSIKTVGRGVHSSINFLNQSSLLQVPVYATMRSIGWL